MRALFSAVSTRDRPDPSVCVFEYYASFRTGGSYSHRFFCRYADRRYNRSNIFALGVAIMLPKFPQ